MDPPWLYCPQLAPGEMALDDAEGRHAERSRRLRPGDAVTLFDGRGRLAPARLVDKSAAAGSRRSKRAPQTCALVELIEHVPASTAALTLITAACKGPRLDWLVEKCTELGVTTLIFAEFARSVVHLDDRHLAKLTRTAVEACKQAGRPWLPRFELAADLAAALKPAAGDLLLVAHPDPTADPLGPWLVHHARRTERLATVVGPEGGLTSDECDLLRKAGAHFVRLGAHILRVETAAVALAAHWATAVPENG
ncbi:MAG: RsmE family RNA methyltransferase [Phycisphaerae bacterium]|jgi:16S rRNA (uracil1498-N3)-methyltransferase